VRRLVDRGELRAFRIGRLLRISEEEPLVQEKTLARAD
jgi:hypothetical protein